MASARTLYQLQQKDMEREAKHERVTDIDAALEDDAAVDAARAAYQGRHEETALLLHQQREREHEVDALRAKLKQVEEKLYGGKVKSPRELEDLQAEAKLLHAQARREEDVVLDIMQEVERALSDAEALQKDLARIEAERRQERQELEAERRQLLADIERLRQEREDLAGTLGPEVNRLYDSLRASKGGQAVARVEQGMCQGCRIHLPLSELQRVRAGQELVRCGSCGRVLYLP